MSKHMTEWLNAYLDGELHRDRLHQVEEHLAECETCRAELEALQNLSGLLHEVPAPEFISTERLAAQVNRAIRGAQDAWASNVFPAMKVTWGTYPSNIGHVDSPGCFRCHDDQHEAIGKPGKKMAASDCNTCHTILAQGSGAELVKLAPEGQPFKHPDALPDGLTCNDCHNGKNQTP